MALVTCLECGATVSNRAVTCPKCGFPIQEEVMKATSLDHEELPKSTLVEGQDYKLVNGVYYALKIGEPRLKETLVIPDGIKSIGIGLGPNNVVRKLVIPDSVEEIKPLSFFKCSLLEEIYLPAHFTNIDSIFILCPSIKTIHSDNFVVENGFVFDKYKKKLFFTTNNVEYLAIPDGVESMAHNALAICNKTQELVLPSTLTEAECAFVGCDSLRTLRSDHFVLDDGIIYNTSRDTIMKIVKNQEVLRIPPHVKKVNPTPLSQHSLLEKVIFEPNSQLECIGVAMFAGSNIKDITIPKSVKKIDTNAFHRCKNLENVTFEENSRLEEIGKSAFNRCGSLTSITLPSSVKNIEESAFFLCDNLKFVYLDNKSAMISDSVFKFRGGSSSVKIVSLAELDALKKQLFDLQFEIDFCENKKESIAKEISELKGLFNGKKRREFENELQQAQADLKKLLQKKDEIKQKIAEMC